MKKYNVVSIGGATRDIIFYTNQGKVISTPKNLIMQKMISFEYGAKLISHDVKFKTGGGACNSAVGLSRLGFKVANYVTVGDDTEGDEILYHLRKEGVDISLIEIKKNISTGFSFLVIDEKTKEHVAFLYRGANDHISLKKDITKISTDWFYMSSLSGKKWQTVSKKVINVLKKKKVKLAWNPGETQLRAGKKGLNNLLKYTSILILNKDESIELVLRAMGKIKGINNPRVLLKTIKEWGPEIFVLTNSRKGAYAYDGKKVYFSRIYDTKIVDTTGAGDCFGASFLAGVMLFDGNIKKAIKLGIQNTASLVMKAGAQNGLLYKKDLKRIFSAKGGKTNN